MCALLLHLPLKSPVAEPMDCMVRSTFSSNHSSAGSHVTLQSHTSHVTLKVTRHTSHVKRHTSHITRHTSHVTRHTQSHTSHVTRHTSHVTRHTSHATRHTSHVTGLQQSHDISGVARAEHAQNTCYKQKATKMKRMKGKAGAAGWGARSVLDHCFFDHGVQHFAGLLRMRFEV